MIGSDLRRYRRSIGITQEELARAIGVSSRTIKRWEAGRSRIPAKKKPEMLEVLTDEAIINSIKAVRAGYVRGRPFRKKEL